MKTKLVEKGNIDYLLDLSKKFKINNTLNTDYYSNIIEFYEHKELIGFINYLKFPSINHYNNFIRSIYVIDDKYLDSVIKKFIEIVKNKYGFVYTSIYNNEYNDLIIDTLLANNFEKNDVIPKNIYLKMK